MSVLCTCRSCIVGALIFRTFPRSRRTKFLYLPGFHFFSKILRRHFAVCEIKCISKFCVLRFHRESPPTALARSVLRLSRASFLRLYLASCLSALFINYSSTSHGLIAHVNRIDRTHETGLCALAPAMQEASVFVRQWTFSDFSGKRFSFRIRSDSHKSYYL